MISEVLENLTFSDLNIKIYIVIPFLKLSQDKIVRYHNTMIHDYYDTD